MENRCTVVILIDALGYELAEGFNPAGLERRVRLRSVLGFSQAALTTILTGCDPQDHGLWMMYSFARKSSPFSWLGYLPGSISSKRLWLRNAIRWKLDRLDGIRSYYSLYEVPRRIFPELDLPSRERMFGPGGAGKTANIFDHLERRGMKWRVWDYSVDEERAFEELEIELSSGSGGFFMLYTAGLDSTMHEHGTSSEQIERKLAWYRERIDRITAAGEDARIMVLGDHGMCDVTAGIDLIRIVDSLGPETCAGLIPFYDSTMARFKVLSDRAGRELLELLSGVEGGMLLDRDSLERFGVFFPDGRFGDVIFLTDPGTIIVPSFMSSEPAAAMHGYDPGADCMAAVMLTNFDTGEIEMDLRQVAGLMVPDFEAGEAS